MRGIRAQRSPCHFLSTHHMAALRVTVRHEQSPWSLAVGDNKRKHRTSPVAVALGTTTNDQRIQRTEERRVLGAITSLEIQGGAVSGEQK